MFPRNLRRGRSRPAEQPSPLGSATEIRDSAVNDSTVNGSAVKGSAAEEAGAASRFSIGTFVKSALGIGVITALGLGAIGGTFAYLNAQATVTGSTLRAGTLGLQINGSNNVAIGTWNVTPNASQAVAFTLKNTGDAPMNVNGTVTVTSAAALRTYTVLRLAEVANAAACTVSITSGVSGGVTAFPATSFTHLAPNETQTMCGIVSLAGSVPIARAGESVAFNIVFNGTQAVS